MVGHVIKASHVETPDSRPVACKDLIPVVYVVLVWNCGLLPASGGRGEPRKGEPASTLIPKSIVKAYSYQYGKDDTRVNIVDSTSHAGT